MGDYEAINNKSIKLVEKIGTEKAACFEMCPPGGQDVVIKNLVSNITKTLPIAYFNYSNG